MNKPKCLGFSPVLVVFSLPTFSLVLSSCSDSVSPKNMERLTAKRNIHVGLKVESMSY